MLNTDRLCLGCMNDNGGEKVCGICGYDSSVQNEGDFLPTKFWINDRYLVGKVLESNGEGVTYIGWDNIDNSIVNIREYFPIGAAKRNPDKTVSIEEEEKYVFNEGLIDFLQINRDIMKSSLPSVIPVLAVFEENGTAYVISSGISGITLKDFLTRNGGTLKWEQAKPLFIPLIDTISGLNALGIIHRGISPETVIVGRDAKLRISGICIKNVRCAESDMTSQIYPGFTAIEQYRSDDLRDSEAADVYGLCATLFRVLIGIVPPEATVRLENDSMSIPAKFADEIPKQVLMALANGLQVLPDDRTPNMGAFKKELISGETVAPEVKAVVNKAPSGKAQPVKANKEAPKEPKKKSSSAKYAVISAACTAGVFIILAGILALTVFKGSIFGAKEVDAESEPVFTPSIEQVGSVDSNAVESAVLYAVPDVSGKYYSQIIDNEEYEKFKFVIKNKDFSDKYAKGTVCAQSVAVGTSVEKDTTIELTISLGSNEIKIANVIGLDESSAKIELLKQGFLYENIEVVGKYDANSAPGKIVEQEPKYGTSANTEIAIKIYINTYVPETSSSSSSSSSSNSSKNSSSSSLN